MNGKPRFSPKVRAGALLAFAVSVPLGTAWAVTGADFDREVQVVTQQLQRQDIKLNADGSMTPPAGAAGQSASAIMAREGAADTGSREFNRYVDEVNQQLRIRNEAADAFSS